MKGILDTYMTLILERMLMSNNTAKHYWQSSWNSNPTNITWSRLFHNASIIFANVISSGAMDVTSRLTSNSTTVPFTWRTYHDWEDVIRTIHINPHYLILWPFAQPSVLMLASLVGTAGQAKAVPRSAFSTYSITFCRWVANALRVSLD